VIIFGSLTTCDPGDIYETLDNCVKDKIRISLVALAAEMKICKELCEKTEGKSVNELCTTRNVTV
jgi:transcription initiation factor TFIIH subunit 2